MSKHTEQIAKMAEREYPLVNVDNAAFSIEQANLVRTAFRNEYEKGGSAVMDALDVDIYRVGNIMYDYAQGKYTKDEAKQQILNAITIKEK